LHQRRSNGENQEQVAAMQIDWEEVVEGLTMIEVRGVTRQLFYHRSTEFIARQTKLSPEKVARLLNEMAERGWVRKAGPDEYETTVAGNALAGTKKLKPMTRASATALLEEVIAAAHAVNADPDMAYCVSYLGVFGSYLGEAEELNDLDITYVLSPRWASHDAETRRAAIERTNEVYPPPASWWALTRCAWPHLIARRRLKVSNRVSLHSKLEIDEAGWYQRTVFGTDGSES
jgi:hypothetical protein